MSLAPVVFSNQLHYYRKIVPITLICGFILLIPTTSILLVQHIRGLTDQPLKALDTELILQHDQGNKQVYGLRTNELVEPFNLHSFDNLSIRQQLNAIPGIEKFSTAMILWEIDVNNTLTVVGINPSDPLVGFRKVEQLLTEKSRFFSEAQAEEVLLERHHAALFGYKIGDTFELADHLLEVIGLIDFKEQSNLSNAAVFLPYKTALSLAGKQENVINQVFVSLTSAVDIDQVVQSINRVFPEFSFISKDNLYKNLSSVKQIIYRGGYFLVLVVIPLALLLLIWTLKLYRLEFAWLTNSLRIWGWSRSNLRCWLAWDIGFLLLGAIAVAVILTAITYWGILPLVSISPLMEQGFQL